MQTRVIFISCEETLEPQSQTKTMKPISNGDFTTKIILQTNVKVISQFRMYVSSSNIYASLCIQIVIRLVYGRMVSNGLAILRYINIEIYT
jgi:hypothetical protein